MSQMRTTHYNIPLYQGIATDALVLRRMKQRAIVRLLQGESIEDLIKEATLVWYGMAHPVRWTRTDPS